MAVFIFCFFHFMWLEDTFFEVNMLFGFIRILLKMFNFLFYSASWKGEKFYKFPKLAINIHKIHVSCKINSIYFLNVSGYWSGLIIDYLGIITIWKLKSWQKWGWKWEVVKTETGGIQRVHDTFNKLYSFLNL